MDTGATFSKIPKLVAARLGLQAKYETEVELGDGRVVKRKLTSVDMEIEEVRRPVLVAIAEEENPLVGYTTLELLGFKVNPITRKLEKAMPIEYKEEKWSSYLSEYKGKSILTTGGADCIGSNLTKALVKANHLQKSLY